MSGGADGTCSDGDAFQLRMEIVDLRKKLKLLDGGGEKSELLSLLQERDDELSAAAASRAGHVARVPADRARLV